MITLKLLKGIAFAMFCIILFLVYFYIPNEREIKRNNERNNGRDNEKEILIISAMSLLQECGNDNYDFSNMSVGDMKSFLIWQYKQLPDSVIFSILTNKRIEDRKH